MDNTALAADHEAQAAVFRATIEELNDARDRLIEVRHVMDLIEANLLAPLPNPITGEIVEFINGRNEAMRKAQLLQHTEANETYQEALAARQNVERRIRTLEGEREIARSFMGMTKALVKADDD